MQKSELDRYVMEKGEFNQEALKKQAVSYNLKILLSKHFQFNMREILGDVLGKNFSNISLKNYKKTLKKIEDKEDYETGKKALKDGKELEELEKKENMDLINVKEAIDVDTLINALPLVYKFGLGMIEGFYGVKNLDLLSEGETKAPDDLADSNQEIEEDILDVAGHNMKPPKPLSREYALKVMKEEQDRYLKEQAMNSLE